MLKIITEYRQGILFVRLIGQLNKNNIHKFNTKVIDNITSGGICNVVFNVEGLKEIDLKGIHLLLYSYELCKKNDGCTLICGNNEYIKPRIKKSHILI